MIIINGDLTSLYCFFDSISLNEICSNAKQLNIFIKFSENDIFIIKFILLSLMIKTYMFNSQTEHHLKKLN